MNWLILGVYLLDFLMRAQKAFPTVSLVLIVGGASAWVLLFWFKLDYLAVFGKERVSTDITYQIVDSSLRYLKKLIWLGVFLGIFSFLIPSKPTMYTMVALKAVDVVVHTDTVQRVVPKSVSVIENYLDKTLKTQDSEKAAKGVQQVP